MRPPLRFVLLLAAALAAIALAWLYGGGQERFGIDGGQLRQLVLRVALAAAAFFAVVYLTRLLTRSLERTVLTPERMERSLAYSIGKTVEYGGLALAVLAFAAFAGLDLTSLAIVAGALSVGIGFGLQNVIQNFVCGLILLLERPVRVGDWVVVRNYEGLVRRISVRATEIETFDKASVLIPNSEMITQPVLNWTHGSPSGRVEIKVRAAAGADPARVAALLIETAGAHAGVLAEPIPQASFDDFGPDALDFTLRVHVADIKQGARARSDLRAAVLAAFRREGVERRAPPPPAPAGSAENTSTA
jgi:small-conductance mechanosensitive channel